MPGTHVRCCPTLTPDPAARQPGFRFPLPGRSLIFRTTDATTVADGDPCRPASPPYGMPTPSEDGSGCAFLMKVGTRLADGSFTSALNGERFTFDVAAAVVAVVYLM